MRSDAIDETARLHALVRCRVLDTPREASFDGIVFTLAQLFRTQFAAFSMLDAKRTWLKAAVGFAMQSVPRHESLCELVVRSDQVLVIEDTHRDPRVAHFPLVTGAPFIRFCAAAPVYAPPGIRVGALCVFDTRPRAITPHQRTQVLHLGRQVSDLLSARIRSG